MQSQVNLQKIDKSIEGILEDLPNDCLSYLRENFEQNISNFVGSSLKLELNLVVDSSSVIPNLIYFAKNGESFLHKLIKEPFLHLYAPSALKEEVERRIAELSIKTRLKELIMKTWTTDILPKIKILNLTDLKTLFEGYFVIGKRDPNDVPFVALNLQLKAHGIITKDPDMIEQPEVRTWRIKGVSSLISVFKKGSFSFFIISKVLPNIVKSILKLGVAILRVMLEVLGEITQFVVGLVSGTIKAISKLPTWLQLLFGLGVLALVFVKKTRNLALDILKGIGEVLVKFASDFFRVFRELLVQFAPLINITIVFLSYLFDSYQETVKQLSSLCYIP